MSNKIVLNVDIDDLDLESGIELISIVENPAIESSFVKLSEDEIRVELSKDKEKQYLSGCVLIPNKEIYRFDEATQQEYYITFSEDAIERIRNKFFKTGQLKMSNIDHNSEDKIEATLIESWICVDEKYDKAVALNLNPVVKGALYVTYHIEDKAVWDSIQDKTGFSLEGRFITTKQKLSKVDSIEAVFEDLINLLDKDE
jgi:hypothetical protein